MKSLGFFKKGLGLLGGGGGVDDSKIIPSISLDLLGHDAWNKFQTYSPKWWLNGYESHGTEQKSLETNP